MVDWPLGPSRAGAGNELGLSRLNIAASHRDAQTTGADLRLIAYRGGDPFANGPDRHHDPRRPIRFVRLSKSAPLRLGEGTRRQHREALALRISRLSKSRASLSFTASDNGLLRPQGNGFGYVHQYSKAINAPLAMPDLAKTLADLGLEATRSSPQIFAEAPAARTTAALVPSALAGSVIK
jgi:hypothetical protein